MHELKSGTMLNLHATNARYRILEMRLADNVKLTELLQLYWVLRYIVELPLIGSRNVIIYHVTGWHTL